ncbi:ABC transporter ATP-binding protein [Bradyrhizobium sp. LHD-71]|uniref:ABC transporter ATP-binding protein n=1 Tax=Bradyrhizobium sp. LHD-71 TaxID=3072141 RepID=UPI00280FEBFD|nr:ABC transporter ATP-binding protein [Bradyrhizobium sp. LHD-71]MDQ8729745.1 ABC transporter ATP-binding protein [Bradyrhizobium sp. LHD-71]
MRDITEWRQRPLAYLFHYVAQRPVSHAVIFCAVVVAVACSVSTQYGIKLLVDTLTTQLSSPWGAFAILVSLIAADNLSWRLASLVASYTFVQVTGDVRRDLFRHLTMHSPSFFSDRLPAVLTSRITATSNAAFTIENMFVWNVLPPCLASVGAILFLASVNLAMAATLLVIAGIVVVVLFHFASRGKPLHHDFASKAALVDGEMVDVVGNMALVKAFCGLGREHMRFDQTVQHELHARRMSLLYLERMRFGHALVTVILTLCLLAWALILWQQGKASAGDVVMVCTLGISVLSATRDLAVALVDVTQHLARLSEAIYTLLVPHDLLDHPDAVPLVHDGADITFSKVSFGYPSGKNVFENFDLHIRSGERVGLVGPSGAGKSTLFTLLHRFYDVDGGEILIDGQRISRITQESLWNAIATVPQDTALFNRSLLENIRYGHPDATDDEVWRAAMDARCNSFIEGLPDGLNTIVGDRGLRLSGGQRQRISIARAFLKNAPILLLDEATSALDTESEEAIREALGRLMAGRTVIAIAHRLSTLRQFDRIVVINDGKVIEDGPPTTLIENGGHFSRLVKKEARLLSVRAA